MYAMRARVIAVVGGREAGEGELREAREAGRLIAGWGAVLVTGGLGGVMEAASLGAAEEGGTVLGILPTDSALDANPWVGIAVATGMGVGRNVIIARTADALVAVGGGYGTLSEIAHALQMRKPVVGIGSWDISGVIPARDAADALRILRELPGC
jgi:hypothetical protein